MRIIGIDIVDGFIALSICVICIGGVILLTEILYKLEMKYIEWRKRK